MCTSASLSLPAGLASMNKSLNRKMCRRFSLRVGLPLAALLSCSSTMCTWSSRSSLRVGVAKLTFSAKRFCRSAECRMPSLWRIDSFTIATIVSIFCTTGRRKPIDGELGSVFSRISLSSSGYLQMRCTGLMRKSGRLSRRHSGWREHSSQNLRKGLLLIEWYLRIANEWLLQYSVYSLKKSIILWKTGPMSIATRLCSYCCSISRSSSWWIVSSCSTFEKRMPRSFELTSFLAAIGLRNTSITTSRSLTYSRSVLSSSKISSCRCTSFSGSDFSNSGGTVSAHVCRISFSYSLVDVKRFLVERKRDFGESRPSCVFDSLYFLYHERFWSCRSSTEPDGANCMRMLGGVWLSPSPGPLESDDVFSMWATT
eukprot:Unigene2095_Nuclearia_a/m.6508 Unigene2095_Nuclearia_a/g.6508  ORF Unigene2095_Nuclearia_a/g.6508 Unigene2095_Nuclearia_a/m.6508 type:complete len:370 (-) Unigene2095_Nuclearia_a:765-1874(-)